MFKEIEGDTLEELVKSDELVFVQYSAGWCGNCKIMKPKFKRFANESEATFVVVDAEKNPNSRKLANVDNLPTFAAFRGGEFVDQVQTNKADKLKEFIDEVAGH